MLLIYYFLGVLVVFQGVETLLDARDRPTKVVQSKYSSGE